MATKKVGYSRSISRATTSRGGSSSTPATTSKKKKKSSGGITSARVEVDGNSSVTARKIENGFIVRESSTMGKGRNQQWVEKEYFSPENPIQVKIPTRASMSGGKKPSFSGKSKKQ